MLSSALVLNNGLVVRWSSLVEISSILAVGKEYYQLMIKLYLSNSLKYLVSFCYDRVQMDIGLNFDLPVCAESVLLGVMHSVFCLRLKIVQLS